MQANTTAQATRLLDCAHALISTAGYNGFSYADVAAQVGITKASIHHHFPKKAELVRSLLERYRASASDGLAKLQDSIPEPAGQLRAYAAWWADCIRDGRQPICICALLGAEMPALPTEVASQVQEHFQQLAAWLESVLAAGTASGVFHGRASAQTTAQHFMATVHGAMLSARALGQPALFKSIVDAALDGLSADAPSRHPPSSRRTSSTPVKRKGST